MNRKVFEINQIWKYQRNRSHYNLEQKTTKTMIILNNICSHARVGSITSRKHRHSFTCACRQTIVSDQPSKIGLAQPYTCHVSLTKVLTFLEIQIHCDETSSRGGECTFFRRAPHTLGDRQKSRFLILAAIAKYRDPISGVENYYNVKRVVVVPG